MGTNTWECPICGSNAYQRHGGVPLKVKKIDGAGNETEDTHTFDKHFMCKGCSVFFSNPNLFNATNVARRTLKQAQQAIDSFLPGLFQDPSQKE